MDPEIVLKLRQDLKFAVHFGRKPPAYVLEDPVRQKFYRIGSREYLLIGQLDGKRTLREALRRTSELLGEDAFSQVQVEALVSWLSTNQLLIQGSSLALDQSWLAERRQERLRHWSRLNLIVFRLPLFNPRKLLEKIYPFFRWTTGPGFFLLWMAVFLWAAYALAVNWQPFRLQAANLLAARNLVWLWLAWFFLKVLHELSHAVVYRKYGGDVHEAGILFIVAIPLTYVDATSSWNFPSRWQRIHLDMAGMYIEAFAAAVALVFWSLHTQSIGGVIAHNVVIVAGVSSVLFNANPLMRFDGYYVLSDLTGIPNLYAHGMEVVYGWFRALFLGIRLPAVRYSGWRRIFLKVYGVAVYWWRILVLVGLSIGASRLFHGMGRIMAFLGIAVWVGMPLYGFIKRFPALRGANPAAGRRLAVSLAVFVAAALFLVFQWGWTTRVRAPAVVQYRRQAVIKVRTPGFVKRVDVHTGDGVRPGQTLLQLENRKTEFDLADTRLQLNALKIQGRRYFNRQNLSAFQIVKENIAVIQHRREALERDVRDLTLRSPVAGVVVGSDLDHLQGVFLRRGHEVLWVVTPQRKVIRVSLAQEDVQAFRRAVGQTVKVDMRPCGLPVFDGRLHGVDPRADRKIPYPALSAAFGGPIDVRQVRAAGGKSIAATRFEFFRPRFGAEVQPPEAILNKLMVGQLATVCLPGRRKTVADVAKAYLLHKLGLR